MKKQKVSTITQSPLMPRNCGMPQLGHIYLNIPSGAYGTPIWNFLLDPTEPLPADFKLCDLGMTLISRGYTNWEGKEIFDVWDHIGGTNYPNPSDWFLEVAHQGLHQLVERTLPFEKLTMESCYYAVHNRAHIVDPRQYYRSWKQGEDFPPCVHDIPEHIERSEAWLDIQRTCPSVFFQDLVKGKQVGNSREVIRENASFSYKGFKAPAGIEPEYEPAAFFKAEIGEWCQFLVYEDPDQMMHLNALEELEKLEESLKRVQIVSFDDPDAGKD